jgi:murein DD-endopeptidase MepM/ murein hydrolase activator NlpD
VTTFSQFVFLISVLFIFAGKAAYAEDNLLVECLPKVVKQGDVCLIRAFGPTSLKSVYGEFQGGKWPIVCRAQSGTYEGLIGIDMNTRPATHAIKVVATDGDSRVYSRALSIKVGRAHFGTQKLSLPSSIVDLDAKTLERVNKETRRLKALFQDSWDEKLWRGPFICPTRGELSAVFGVSRIINGQRRSPHTGVDLKADKGAPVLPCNNGRVVLVDQLFFSGTSVILDHGGGLHSMYFHLSEALVKKGDAVTTGAILGRVGSTGRSTGPHLHWGIRINGARVDPLSLLRLTEHLQE